MFLFVINLSNIIVNIEGEGQTFSWFTVHTLGNTASDGVLAKGGHSYAVMEFLTAGCMVAYLFFIRGEMETIYDRVRGSGQKRKLAAADFTVMVGNVPSSWGSARVREFFEKSFGDVVHVGLSLDYRTLIQAVNTTRTLKNRHNDLLLYLVQVLGAASSRVQQEEGMPSPKGQAKADVAKVGRARAAVIKSLAKLEEHDKHIKGLMRRKYRCTGYAFVTFDKLVTAQAVKKAFEPKHMAGYLRILGGGLTVHPAPEPHDVIWENLQCPPREVLLRQVVSCVIMVVLCMLGTVILWSTNAFLMWDNDDDAFQWVKSTSAGGFFAYVGIWLLSVLLIVVGHLVLIIAVIVMANVLERPHTHADKEISVMLKISFFQWFNNCAQSIAFVYLATAGNPQPNGEFGAGWYSSGGALIINALIGDLVLINLLIDGLKPEVLLQRYVFTRSALTQSRMNEMWVMPADITLAMRMQLTNKFLMLALQFSFAIPVLYALLAAHMWVAHWVDRWNFLHRLSPPPPTHGRLVVLMTEFFLPLSVLLHLIMAPLFFWHICENPEVVHTDTGGGGASGGGGGGGDGGLSPSDLVNSSLTSLTVAEQGSGVLGGGGGGGGVVSASCSCADRLLEGLSSASLSCSVDADMQARCEVEVSGFSETCGNGAIWQSSAMLILLSSTVIWGAILLWYVYSGTEHQRSKRSKERAQGRAAGLTVLPRRALNLFRFLMQRDVHHAPPRTGLPAGAYVLPLHREAKPGYVHATKREAAAAPRSNLGRTSAGAVGGTVTLGDGLTHTFVDDTAPDTPRVAVGTGTYPLEAPPLADTASVQLHMQNGRQQGGQQGQSVDSKLSGALAAPSEAAEATEAAEAGEAEARDPRATMCINASAPSTPRSPSGLADPSLPPAAAAPASACGPGASRCSLRWARSSSGSSSSPQSQQAADDEAEAQPEPMTMDERVTKQAAHMERRLTAHMEALAAASKAFAPAAAPGVGRLRPLRMSLVPMAPTDEMTARSQLGASQLLLSSVEGDVSFREADLVQLDEDSAFYLPPLVVTLLSSFCKDVGNRAVRNYIKHHRPLQKAEDELEEAQRQGTGYSEAQRQGRTSMSELMRSGSIRIESISRGAANLNMPNLNMAAALPTLLRPVSTPGSGAARQAMSMVTSLASSRLSKCRMSGSSPGQLRGGLSLASARGEGEGSGEDLSVLEQLDEARAAIEMVEGIDAVELVRQRSMSHGSAEAWGDGESSSLSVAESEALDGDRELAIAALEQAAERLQQKALREQQKLLREKERRSSQSNGRRSSQSSPGSQSDPAYTYESPGRLAAASSSSEPARTPNTATTSPPTSPHRKRSIGDAPEV